MPLRTLNPRSKTGLFSAAVATLVSVSVQDLTPNSQDITAFYLANIYQILADSNGSQVPIPFTFPNPSTPFSPPTSAVWVNILWFLSLVISLTCALLATLLQQWARRYMKVTQTRYSPHKRARIRAFFAEGVEKLHLPWAVEALPALLHLSLFLFFAGLSVFLFNINHAVFNVMILWVAFCTGMYVCITLMPMFRHDSPYYAPFSSSAWYLYAGTLSVVFRISRWVALRDCVSASIYHRINGLWETYLRRISLGMEKGFEESALEAPSQIDGRALMWTYEYSDEDHELEQFFAGIPGFCNSKVVDNPQSSLDSMRSPTMALSMNGFLDRTWSSNLLSEMIKIRRLVICVRAADAARLSNAALRIFFPFFLSRPSLLRSVELGHSLMSWGHNDDRKPTLFAQGLIACIIANVPQRNERSFSLTMHHLGISEHVLRDYLDHGDNVLLANLIHFTRQFVRNFLEVNWEDDLLSYILHQLRLIYNVQETLPMLQHDFCGLWNEIVLKTRNRDHHLLSCILTKIHPIYVALHQGHTPHDRYQLCSIPSHQIDSTSNLSDVDGGMSADTAPVPITTSPTLHDAVPSVIPPLTAPPTPTSNLNNAILHVVVGEQSRNGRLDNITPGVSSVYPAPLGNDRLSSGTVADPTPRRDPPGRG